MVKAITGIGAVVVATAIVIGGWQLGWWSKTSTPNRTAVTSQPSSVRQLEGVISQIDQLDSQLVNVNISQGERATLTPQKATLVTVACGMSARIAPPLPPAEAAFVTANC